MAIPGQRFELDLDAEDFSFNALDQADAVASSQPSIIKEIQEHDPTDLPPAPKIKQTQSGFPEHKSRRKISAYKQKQEQSRIRSRDGQSAPKAQPSDAAIRHRVANKYGYDPASQEKAQISEENKQRLAAMSEDDIAEAQAELLQSLNPALLERFMKRANIDEDQTGLSPRQIENADDHDSPEIAAEEETTLLEMADAKLHERTDDLDSGPAYTHPPVSSVHFPTPVRDPGDFKKLDPESSSFLKDLRTQYFPELSHNPSSLDWLQSEPQEPVSHSYAPHLDSYPATSLRFGFAGNLIPPTTSHEIPVSAGLHHHGDAPDAAGYTIPELTLLARSMLPNQRCMSYQTIGRILYRLGKGNFGQPGSELNEALWGVVEEERVMELIMAEANREGGHASAKAYSTEALWLWRKGGGGERGLKKPGERRAK